MGIMGERGGFLVRLTTVGVVVLLVGLAACSRASEVPVLEQRAQNINSVVMCPVCPGESIDQSQNALALQMRGVVVEKLEAGWSDRDIYDFFVERYGPSVLQEPPRQGINLAVWLIPPIGVSAAVGLLYFVMRLMVRSQGRRSSDAKSGDGLTDEERERYFRGIEAALSAEGPAGDARDESEGGG